MIPRDTPGAYVFRVYLGARKTPVKGRTRAVGLFTAALCGRG